MHINVDCILRILSLHHFIPHDGTHTLVIGKQLNAATHNPAAMRPLGQSWLKLTLLIWNRRCGMFSMPSTLGIFIILR